MDLPVIDPTRNVADLVAAEARRQDGLREMALAGVEATAALRALHYEQLREAEAKRIDANRAGDGAAMAMANERSILQASVLADQLTKSNEANRLLISTTAEGVAKNLAGVVAQINDSIRQQSDRIALLEQSKYQILGHREQSGTDQGQANANRAVYLTLGVFVLAELLRFLVP